MKTALITGANRGIGLELAYQLKEKGYNVIGCCRTPRYADELKKTANQVIELDVTNDEDILNLKEQLTNHPIDLLINNAGITGESGVTIGNINRENFLNVLNVNTVSVVKLSEVLLPNVEKSQEKSILIISSSMSSITNNNTGRSYAYRSSKAALNCVMRSFALDVSDKGIKIMLVHPGWVKTDMGGENAEVELSESVQKILAQAQEHLADSHAHKLHSFNGDIIPW